MSIKYKSSLTLVAAAMTSAVLLSGTASAASPSEPVVVTGTRDVEQETRIVSYRDLNLAAARDQRRLDRRVGSAIKDVCAIDEYHAVRTLASFESYRSCSTVAWSGARPQIAAAIAQAQALAGLEGRGQKVATMAITISARAAN